MEDETNMKLEKYKIILDFLKFEATTLWQIFGAFFIAHAIFIGFIATSFAESKNQNMNYGLFLIVGIVGFLLTILWFGTFYRNSKWYNFRMNQAKKAEACLIGDTDKWYLLNKDANSFSDGEKVTIIIEEPENKKNKKECQIDVIGIKNEIAGYIMIIIFALIYLNIIIWSLIKISC